MGFEPNQQRSHLESVNEFTDRMKDRWKRPSRIGEIEG